MRYILLADTDNNIGKFCKPICLFTLDEFVHYLKTEINEIIAKHNNDTEEYGFVYNIYFLEPNKKQSSHTKLMIMIIRYHI